MMNYLQEYLKIFRPRTFKKVITHLYHVAKQDWYLVKKGKFKEAYNYAWARIFSIEEGLGLMTPFYKINPNWAPQPGRIELEVTNVCRFRCPKCEHTYWKEKQENMSFEAFKRIIEQFPNLKSISATGIGHGFENPDYFKMLKYLKDKSLFVQFFDPLFLPDEKVLRELINLRVNWIWISFDGATKETYEKSIVGSNFDKVLENIRMLVRLRNEMKSPFPEIHFQPIITKYNFHEMPKFIELIYELTKDANQPTTEINFIKLIPFKENEWLAPEITEDVLRATEEAARKHKNLVVTSIRMSEEEHKPYIEDCVSWTVPFITVDGKVYACCAVTEGNFRAEARQHALGDLTKEDFRDIWKSQKFKGFVRAIHDGKDPWLCCGPRECPLFKCHNCKSNKC